MFPLTEIDFNTKNDILCINLLICVRCTCDPPGDVEERKANAVFDEDGEVFHVQHWFAEEDVDREGGVRMTIKRFIERNVWC